MSHTVTMGVQISDLDALESACKVLGLELVRNKHEFKVWGTPQRCDHVVRIPNNTEAYEVGIRKNEKDSNYTMLTDFYNGGRGMEAKVGQEGQLLSQHYTAQLTKAYWQEKGFRVTESLNEEKELVLACVK